MTTNLMDLPNADVVVLMGSNAAENHPISFKWILRAKENGATIISIDPRFTRSSAKADIWMPMRSGADVAVMGGFINYAIQNNRVNWDYVRYYTNAPFLLSPDYKFEDGLFSGWDPQKKTYDQRTWAFQTEEKDGKRVLKRDETMQDANSVFQQMKKHYSRYTPEMVERVAGVDKDQFLRVADIITSTYLPNRAAVFGYAMGWTQHSNGVQTIRASTLLQMLLGNIGMPGGGIAALRGHANVQGATDLAVLYQDLPGYLGVPTYRHTSLKGFLDATTARDSYWDNKPKFMVSLLKAWYGDAATKENDFAYHYLGKMDPGKPYSHYDIFEAALKGEVKGLVVVGQNPAVGSANAKKIPPALAKLDWLFVTDIFETDTMSFWKKEMFGLEPSQVKTEIFVLPAAAAAEKSGSFTNTHRHIQWKWKVVDPPGQGKSDAWIIDQLAKRLKKLYASSTARKDRPILDMTWSYDGQGGEVDTEKVLKEINGYDVKTGKLLPTFGLLKDDGSTASGCWIYTGVYQEDKDKKGDGFKAASRVIDKTGKDYMQHGWGWSWPANRRILYNRASADPDGKSWSKRPLVWWDPEKKVWTGNDVPDFAPTNAPDRAKMTGQNAFIMKSYGAGAFFGPLIDGPFPEHYEPVESPVRNLLGGQQYSPKAVIYRGHETDKYGDPAKFPIILTTYRVTEHHLSGIMTRMVPWLAEAFPEPFVEMSPQLAKEKGIANGDQVIVKTARGEVKVNAIVSERFRPFTLNGRTVHEVGLPIHWSKKGIVTGDITNWLTPQVTDPIVFIQESKAFIGDIEKAR